MLRTPGSPTLVKTKDPCLYIFDLKVISCTRWEQQRSKIPICPLPEQCAILGASCPCEGKSPTICHGIIHETLARHFWRTFHYADEVLTEGTNADEKLSKGQQVIIIIFRNRSMTGNIQYHYIICWLRISVGFQQEKDAQRLCSMNSVQTPEITLPPSAFLTYSSTFPVGLSRYDSSSPSLRRLQSSKEDSQRFYLPCGRAVPQSVIT
ncbi:uncharacterized protein LOC142600747 [Balearica regulorum gibbericeps]|uniref:uncharacterized protein LOC142600747 n=1 Tax=Balearica regulorum gibbericeps TaxID=100784 RepID=UPI003F60F162